MVIDDLKKNIEFVVSLYEQERQRIGELSARLVLLESEVTDLRQQNADLKNKIGKLEIANAFAGREDTSFEAKESIDKLVRQIDQCIKLLEK